MADNLTAICDTTLRPPRPVTGIALLLLSRITKAVVGFPHVMKAYGTWTYSSMHS
jgi:hypothetical protein